MLFFSNEKSSALNWMPIHKHADNSNPQDHSLQEGIRLENYMIGFFAICIFCLCLIQVRKAYHANQKLLANEQPADLTQTLLTEGEQDIDMNNRRIRAFLV